MAAIDTEYAKSSKTPIIECTITRFLEDQVPSVDGEGTDYDVEVVSCDITAGFDQGTATCTLIIKNPYDVVGNPIRFEPMDRVKIRQGWNVTSTFKITFFGFVDTSELVNPGEEQRLECRDMLKLAQDNYLIHSNRRVYSAEPDPTELDEYGQPMGGQDPEDRTVQAIISELLTDSGIGTHRQVLDFVDYPEEGSIVIGNYATAVFVHESALDAITRICDLIGYRIWADQIGCVHCREVDQIAAETPSVRYKSRNETYVGAGSWVTTADVSETFEWGNDGDSLLSGYVDDPIWYVTVTGASVAEIDTSQCYGGTRSARLYRDGTNMPVAYFYHSPVSQDQVVSFRVRKDDTSRATFTMGDGTSRVTICLYEDETIRYYDTSWKTTGKSVSADSWYEISIKNVNWEDKIYDIYRGSTLVKREVPMQANTGYQNQMAFRNDAGTSECWYDNISVHSIAGNLLSINTNKDDDLRNWVTVIGYGDLSVTVAGESDYVPDPPKYRRTEVISYLLDTNELITAVANRIYTDLNRLRYTANISIEGDPRLSLGMVVWAYDEFTTEQGMSYILYDYSSRFTAGSWIMDLTLTGGVGTGSEPVGNISPVALFDYRVEREVIAGDVIWSDIFVDASPSYDPDGEFDDLTFLWVASGFENASTVANTYQLTGQNSLTVTLTVTDSGEPPLSNSLTRVISCVTGASIKWKTIFIGSDDSEVYYTVNGGESWSSKQVF